MKSGQIVIKDSTLHDETQHPAVYCSDFIDEDEIDRNVKLVEIELNLYELEDAINEIKIISLKINQNLKNFVDQNNQNMMAEMIKTQIYTNRAWIYIEQKVKYAQEILNSFKEIDGISISELELKTRRTIHFYKKSKIFIDSRLNYNPDSKKLDPSSLTEKPRWFTKVVVDLEKVNRNVDLLLAEK